MSNSQLQRRPVSRSYRVTVSAEEAITLHGTLKRDIADTERILANWPLPSDDLPRDDSRQRVADFLEQKKRLEDKLARKLLLRR